MIDLAPTLPNQLAEAARYQDGAPTIRLQLPRRRRPVRRAFRWAGMTLGGIALSIAVAAVGLGCAGAAIITGLWPL